MSELMPESDVTIPRYATVVEVAAALRCSKSQVYNLIYSGELPTVKVAGKTLCRAIDVNRYVRMCERASGIADDDEAFSKPSESPPDQMAARSANGALSAHRRSKRLMHLSGS